MHHSELAVETVTQSDTNDTIGTFSSFTSLQMPIFGSMEALSMEMYLAFPMESHVRYAAQGDQ